MSKWLQINDNDRINLERVRCITTKKLRDSDGYKIEFHMSDKEIYVTHATSEKQFNNFLGVLDYELDLHVWIDTDKEEERGI